ncbi:unnamed protein product [Urochloa decumbens]|uniref:Disease resistance protein At4g27190-like leucine-rich repeats domain-containing protein n=1 Tax=Urochloa decumbens TaxID=240449 RepID=A0ABC9BWE6_9POAL
MQRIIATNIKTAVQQITPLLEDTSKDAPKVIYFDGWYGVGASAVLRAISKRPPLSLWEKFDKIIHIDCSRWKSRRALQRAITDELNLTQQVAADFERQDEEDDFSGVDQASRKEIEGISRVIARSLVPHRCLVVFHNGGDVMVDLTSCGIPQPELFSVKVLWTFRGRLRINSDIYESAYDSHLIVDAYGAAANWTALLEEEAREIALYTHELGLGVTPEITTKCCLYYLSLKYRDDDVLSYNWAIHASSYWVCDGIVGEGEDNLAWELARAMQQHIILEDYTPVEGRYSSYMNRPPKFVSKLEFAPKHWISITNSYFKEVPPGTTSIFFAPKKSDPLVSLPSDKFLKADQLRVLKLCLCTFSFSSPPFHCCPNLRFLGLDRCMDLKQLGGKGEEEEETGALAVEIFQRLWVLDVCRTDWDLAFPWKHKSKSLQRMLERCTKVNLCWSAAATASASKGTVQFAACSPLPKSSAYHDISIEQITAKIDGSSSSAQFPPLNVHMEISEGIADITNEVSTEARSVIGQVMNGIRSLHVHDSSSITTVAPEHIVMFPKEHKEIMNGLRWCRVEGCPKLDKVFATNHNDYSFSDLETFWAAHLLRARSIWSRRARQNSIDWTCFTDLRAVHLHCCPRLRYVAALSPKNTYSYRLETLHIVCCGELRQVFPMEQELPEETRAAAASSEQGTLRFPKLKDLYLHELPSLQLICERKMFAPNLETIHIRGCWSLRRLPATDSRRRQDGRPVAVDCEKDWWDNLEWDGMESGHHSSLFEARHSKYYKKQHLRGTVLQ